ncbi:dynein axonemal heavy chain 2 [Drosophila willistoni]|uniref:dynein axonemal heavy chain 2 n=1 Tax=Drosophila willistoni TaxID=7260 RepID=UPI001F07B8FE|nr:dynein axonemal heavy chain 2 [Drosophila willistoni]
MDAAAQSGGRPLNDYIWSGPDLLNSLFDLLLSFRVAICGDIAEIVPNRFCQQYPQAAQAVMDYHYVDDFIYNGDDYVEVGNIATQVRDIYAAGGFHIRNWSSNSKEVLRILKSDSLLPEAVKITATEKVLGLYWVPNYDVFTFICDKTKREHLQVLMSMLPFYKIMVPTSDSVRYEYIVSKLLAEEHPVMLVGNVGTGKTSTAVSVMEACDKNKYCIFTINISAQTTAAGLQESIENRTEKRTKTQFVPIGGKRMICFMDDFNMPANDAYGSQQPLELIRQWIDYKYWFNRKTQQKIYVQNTLLVTAMGPPGGGRQVISSRTQSRFVLLNLTFPTHETIVRIFGTMLRQKLENFSNEVRELWLPLTQCTIFLYISIINKMLPTPNKSHYLFNMRDISKVFQGLLRSQPELQSKKNVLLRLWIHESFRVFSDRLVDDTDQAWFINMLNEALGKHFEVTFHNLCPSKQAPLFGDFAHPQGFYEDLQMDTLRTFMINQLNEYNNFPGMARMNLVFFKEAIEHIIRILRVISQPRGHMLNMGIGGSGRQVLSKLAAFIYEMGIFQIEVTKKYKMMDLREDLKQLYKLTGIKQHVTIFIFSNEQIAEISFLEILNNMLSTGEINLFKSDEFDELKSDLERPAKKAGIVLTTEALYSFFMHNVRDYMHIALCFSPIGESFRNYIRQYPALLSATTPNWFRLWPQEALLEVASHFLHGFQLNVVIPGKEIEKHRDSLVMTTESVLHREIAFAFSIIHSSVAKVADIMLAEVKRHNYVTSPNYLQLVSGFKHLLEKKRLEVSTAANRLRNGLSKIAETQEKVSIMSEELKTSSELVKVLAKECEEFISMIEIQKYEATEQKEKVDAEAVVIKREEIICLDLAATARADLEVVMPMIDAAVKALDALNKKDIAEVKSYGRPPMKIEKVMEAILILLGKDPTWENAKKVLSESTFLNDLKNFERDHISDKTLKRIAMYTKNPELEPDKVAVVSVACKSLMQWIMAIENYGKVFRIVAPKQEKLDNAMRSLEEKQAALAAAKKKLEELQTVIEELYRQLHEKTDLLNELRTREERLRKQLERAIILVESLSGERERWIETVALLDLSFEKLPGDCLLSTAFMSYLGAFDTKYRDTLLTMWSQLIKDLLIPATSELKITHFLSDAVSVREWNIQGLPADDLSTENGVIVTQGSRWPLIIDPQMQANNWIKNMEDNNGLVVMDLGMSDYLRQIEKSIKDGLPVLLQNIGESLDQAINPVLRRSFTIQGGEKLLKFNDKYIAYNSKFRLYITTKISNPHYPPELSSKTTIVNFALKQDGLEAQLLAIIVRKEKPSLEEQKDELVMTIARNKRTLIDLDNEILRLLNESRGSLLDDDELFSTLQKSRQTSVLVKESLSIAEVTEVEIDAARQEYKPASERAAILFFVLMDMSKIDPMYVFSLASYILLFTQSIERSPRNQLVHERIQNINDYHTYSVYKNTCRGLFEKHKLLFSIHMSARILSNAGKLVEDEYEFILKGGIVMDKQGQAPNPAPWWITEQNWDNITELDKVSGFHGIISSFEQSFKAWNGVSLPFLANTANLHNGLWTQGQMSNAAGMQHGPGSQLSATEHSTLSTGVHSTNLGHKKALLSSEQIAARQVLNKDLPVFSGKPEEWLLFISHYEQSTERCGISNEENLIRLQKCLKGAAWDAVRGKLMCPETVPYAIGMLRMLYGRPEIIHSSLQRKLREEPAARSNNLDSVIQLALAVQNYCATLVAIGLKEYLHDPALLGELVEKLPGELKLE